MWKYRVLLVADTSMMDSWTEDEVCQWLAKIGISDQEVMKTVEAQKIRGEVLHHMTDSEVMEVFAEALCFGDRKTIQIERESLLKAKYCKPGVSTNNTKNGSATRQNRKRRSGVVCLPNMHELEWNPYGTKQSTIMLSADKTLDVRQRKISCGW